MTFDSLHSDIHCNCIENTMLPNGLLFTRKISKSTPSQNDFKSKWERATQEDKNQRKSCKEICSFKGISMDWYEEQKKEDIIQLYKTKFSFSPKKKCFILIFQLLAKSGLVKHTPTQNRDTHYDFFKSDQFDITLLQIEEIITL